jgi:hypothetical protein
MPSRKEEDVLARKGVPGAKNIDTREGLHADIESNHPIERQHKNW